MNEHDIFQKHNNTNTLIEIRKADSKHGKWSETEKTHTFSWRLEKKWCRNGVWGVFGSVSVEKEIGKTVNSHKKSREKLKKFKEIVFETQNMCFLRLKWVANKSPGQAAKTLKDKIVKNISKCFSWLESLPYEGVVSWAAKISVYPSWLDLSLANKSPKITRKLAAVACDLDDPWLSCQNRATLFLKFFSFCKNKVLSKNT